MTWGPRSGMLAPMCLSIHWVGFASALGIIVSACEGTTQCPPLLEAVSRVTSGEMPGFVRTVPDVADGGSPTISRGNLTGFVLRSPGSLEVVDAPEGDSVLIDPRPYERGEHVMHEVRWTSGCEVEVADTTRTGPIARPRRAIFGPLIPDGRLGALVLATEAPDGRSASDEWWQWEGLFEDLGVSGLSLSGFTGLEADNEVERVLEERLAAMSPGGVFVLVTSGPASAAGPGLIFGLATSDSRGRAATPRVLSWGRLAAVLQRSASHLGLLIWVVDSSLAGEVRLPLDVPSLLIRGSDRFAPNSPRLDVAGPSALPLALGEAIAEVRAETCVEGMVTDPGELARVLVEAAGRVRPHLLRLRWERIGLPVIAALDAAGRLTPQLRDQVAGWLERQVVREVMADNLRGQALLREEVCEVDGDCAPRDVCLGGCGRHRCEDGSCIVEPTPGEACDDGDVCTYNDTCRAPRADVDGDEGLEGSAGRRGAGACLGEPVVCDDGVDCTDEACEPGRGCVVTPSPGRSCDDSDRCTLEDRCDDEGQCGGVASLCDDGDPCTVDTCDPVSGCAHEPRDGLACDDGNGCTLGDRCQSGLCLGAARPCGDNNPCTVDRCDPATGDCVFAPLSDLVSCVDDDPCTTASRCVSGRCEGLVRTCDDGVACTLDQCAANGTCRHLPAPGTCLSPLSDEGCIPVGSSPADNPCLTCVATGVFEAEDGTSCGPGEGCAARRCEAGACVVRDDAVSCSTPSGTCVGVGEPITECLTCLGGGVASAVTGESCAGPPECGLGTCVAGTCQTPLVLPCCPPKVFQCGESWEVGPEDFAGLVSRVDVWAGGPARGPERWFEVVSPCQGTMSLMVSPVGEVEGSATLVLDAEACVPGLLSAGSGVSPPYPSGPLGTSFAEIAIEEGQPVSAALEVTGAGRWIATSVCQCESTGP